MKKYIIAAIALLATSSAFAASLPSKKAAPLPPVRTPTFLANELTGSADFSDGDVVYGLGLTHNLGNGFFIGAAGTSTPDRDVQTAEATVGVKFPVIAGLSLKGSASSGYKFKDENFPYYALRVGADYSLSSRFTWNAVEYRYRNSYESVHNSYESHRVGTGLTYTFNERHSVGARVYRQFDGGLNKDSDGVLIGYSFRF